MLVRILTLENQRQITNQLEKIGVDKRGISIMAPKADFFVAKIDRLSSIAANILKQEMLSLGGEVAISRWSITAKQKTTPCLLMGNKSQFNRLMEKIKVQPFDLRLVSQKLNESLLNYEKEMLHLKVKRFNFLTGKKTKIMGIINITFDSFSQDGLLRNFNSKEKLERLVLNKAISMVRAGADIIDIGAESSRPGAKPISAKEEKSRLLPALKLLIKEINVPISVDTYKPEVAKLALDNGASIINDITGLSNPKMRKYISAYKAAAVIMHMQGRPQTMQKSPHYLCLLGEIIDFFEKRIKAAVESGIDFESLVIDPGIGFGKTLEHNIEILKNLREFRILGRPILVGVSRKSFIGMITKKDVSERLFGTAAAVAVSVNNGADIVRVHDVEQIKQVLLICDKIKRAY